MHISEIFQTPKGHENFEFVDISLSKDTKLFIDPCLIEISNSEFCQEAQHTINDYFDKFYGLYRNNASDIEKLNFFDHSHEINATKLGYGTGSNGKAKTAEGMVETFLPLQRLFGLQIPISKAIDLPIFIRDFAEDCLSDMLTNILFQQLCKYTVKQCRLYGVSTQPIPEKYCYWETETHSWNVYHGECLLWDNKLVLLVPKNIVRHRFYYNADQYFNSVILEKMQEERTTYDRDGKANKPTKKSLKESLLTTHSDVLEIIKEKTTYSPMLLNQYHNNIRIAYSSKSIPDGELDYWCYTR